MTQHNIPEVLELQQRCCDNLKSHKTHSPSRLIVHPFLAALHCKVTAKGLAPAEWLRHAVIGTVPACVLHQCQGDAWVDRVLRVSPCHGFILKWNTRTTWESLLRRSSLQHKHCILQCNVYFQASEGIVTVPSLEFYQQTGCVCMCVCGVCVCVCVWCVYVCGVCVCVCVCGVWVCVCICACGVCRCVCMCVWCMCVWCVYVCVCVGVRICVCMCVCGVYMCGVCMSSGKVSVISRNC